MTVNSSLIALDGIPVKYSVILCMLGCVRAWEHSYANDYGECVREEKTTTTLQLVKLYIDTLISDTQTTETEIQILIWDVSFYVPYS